MKQNTHIPGNPVNMVQPIETIPFKNLIDVVMRPKYYFWVVNVPGTFDAAEYLLNNYWDKLKAKEAKAVEEVLIKSGQYKKAE